MLLEIFNQQLVRQDLIREFDYVQYKEIFNGVGDFKIKVPIKEKSLQHIKRNNYILFELQTLGIITYLEKDSATTAYVIIKGQMLNRILDYRTIIKTENYSGKISDIIKKMVTNQFITPTDAKRKISQLSIKKDLPISKNEYAVQYTGTKVSIAMQEILQNENWGYRIVPVVVNPSDDQQGNISTFELQLITPNDRTIGNTSNNNPVVFGYDFNNLKNLSYTEDGTEYANVMIVAAEGQAQERKILEVGETEKSGMERIEHYVDARDLQSTTAEGETIPEADYNKMLEQRGREKQQDYVVFNSFDGTPILESTMFILNKDYFLGDFVTVIDKNPDRKTNVQITSLTYSYTTTGKVIDLYFGYERKTVREILRKDGNI